MSSQKKSPKTNAPPAAAAPFTTLQRVLPKRLGLSIEEIRARRDQHLQEGLHWAKVGNAILYSEAGVALLARLAGVKTAPPPPAAPRVIALGDGANACAPLALLQAPKSLRVWRAFPLIRNRHIVEVYIDGTHPEDRKNIELLWVKDNKGFRPGQVIGPEAYEHREEGQYNYIGRQPRL